MPPYVQQVWNNNDLSTPLSASRMTHIEAGLGDHETRLGAAENKQATTYQRIFTCGHSFSAGQNLTNASRRFISILASRYGTEDINAGIGGAVFSSGDSIALPIIGAKPGGHQTINRFVRPDRGLPFADLNIIIQGFNDLLVRDPIAPTLLALSHTFRMGIARMRCGAIWENEDSRFAYNAGFTLNTTTDSTSSSGSNRVSSTTGSTVTMTITAGDFNGATTADLFLCFEGSGAGSTVNVTMDGVSAGSINIQDLTNGDAIANSGVVRIPNVAAGNHTIVATTSGTGTAYFDWAGISARKTPVVVLCTQFLPVASRVVTGAHTPVTQADISAMNNVIINAAAEWDSRVVVARHDQTMDATMFASLASTGFTGDTLHPNEYGHEVMAQTVIDAIDNKGSSQPFEPQIPKAFIIGATNMPAFATNWSNSLSANYPTLRYYKIGRKVRLLGNIKKSIAGAAGEVIITLPTGFRPATVQAFIGLATGNVLGWGRVDVDGTLRWSGGDPTGFWSVDLTFDADGA